MNYVLKYYYNNYNRNAFFSDWGQFFSQKRTVPNQKKLQIKVKNRKNTNNQKKYKTQQKTPCKIFPIT